MQAPQNPLLELARTDPRCGDAVCSSSMQGQQDLALKRDEQRLTMGTRVAEYVGRVAQGVTSPETLEQARQELARIHPQAAAQLPQTYSKEAMVPFVKKAVSVKDNALLQLETWKNQIEEQKLGVQLANAGYQGLGTDVTAHSARTHARASAAVWWAHDPGRRSPMPPRRKRSANWRRRARPNG